MYLFDPNLISDDAIGCFFVDGVHSFLSNFYESPITVIVGGKSKEFLSVEHYYQAAKAASVEDFDWVANSPTPGTAKKRGREIQLRSDWDEIKLMVMRRALDAKFPIGKSELSDELLATGNRLLVEGNWWGDKFWGVDIKTKEGHNWLGHLLMARRVELASQSGKLF